MKEIRTAIVGLGGRSHYWIHLLQKAGGYRIVAICDPVEPTHAPARACLENSKDVKSYLKYEEVLADKNIDAIALTVRCKEQGLMAAQAMEAGKHVSQEVPAAHTIEDCWRIVTAQERTGKVYLSAEQVRYGGIVDAWRQMVAAGTLGKITYAEGQYFHYYPNMAYRNPTTGEYYSPAEAAKHPEAVRTWIYYMPPIHYLIHDLSPLLKILDDRAVEVVGMSTASPSAAHPQLASPDLQIALAKTAKGAILRMAVSFAQPHPEDAHHWLQVIGTGGCVEMQRSSNNKPKMWLANAQMHSKGEVDWRYERTDAPSGAHQAGHAGMDYYVHEAFRDAVLDGKPLEFDVYKAMDVVAVGIQAAESIERGSAPMRVPDFRPGRDRASGKLPGNS